MYRIEGKDLYDDAARVLDQAEGELRDAMMTHAGSLVEREWGPSLMSAAGTQAERKLLATGATADISTDGITLNAAQGPTLSGGLTSDQWTGVEYGMRPRLATRRIHTASLAGSGRKVRVAQLIWIGRNFKDRNPRGYVIFPTVRREGPRFVAHMIYGLIDVFRRAPVEIERD